MESPGHLGAHTRGMPWDNGDAGSVPKPVFAPTGELPSPKKGNSGLDVPHTSDTSWWPETWFISRATVSMDGGSKKKRKIKFRGAYYQPEKGSMLTWKPYFSPTPSLKILTGPWHSESADTNFPWFRSDPGRILKSQRCPLLNHILTIHWGRLCWEKKKNHYPTFTCLFFFEKKIYMHSISYESDFLQWFLYIKINNFPLI